MYTPPPTPPQPPGHLGRVLLAHLALVLVLHLGRQWLDDDAGIFFILFGLAFLDGLAFLVLITTGRARLGLSFVLSGLLMFVIGFGDCATHLKLGNMH
ncbi:hypothetical protein [Hymenobacter jeollabukensis]|uniref:Uncharacterized protein n=1 Tax=Hymenobacter jeollabukensis TaxID=2025313 RepID=A0A5R8WNB9_9BACT|nr:hypothetical protein [Hymenobacter jeollabukensis]TLM91204.1 hypothetical protein FDY95_16555 [Hymenobacter jeollabukensis]